MVHKILLISDYLPGENTSGGVVLFDQVRLLSKVADVDAIVFSAADHDYIGKLPINAKAFIRSKPGENQIPIKPQRAHRTTENVFNFAVLNLWLRNERKFVRATLKNGGYSHVLITVQGLYMAKLFEKIDFGDSRLIIQYWDPDLWWAEQHNFSNKAKMEIVRRHIDLESRVNTSAVLVPSEGMKRSILQRSGILESKVRVFYPLSKFGVDYAECPEVFKQLRKQYSKLIVFTGSMYAFTEIKWMINTLSSIDFKLENEDEIGFVIIGLPTNKQSVELYEYTKRLPNLHLLGRIPAAQVDSCLKLSDLNFLPYPFWHRLLVEESFPSKLAKYLGAEKPILIFAPSYSSLSRMLNENGLTHGVVEVLSKTNICNQITQLLTNQNVIAEQKKQLSRILNSHFTEDIAEETLLYAINHSGSKIVAAGDVMFRDVLVKVPNDWIQKCNVAIRYITFAHSLAYSFSKRPHYYLRRIFGVITRRVRKHFFGLPQ
jgi:Glycosyl transferases group 1